MDIINIILLIIGILVIIWTGNSYRRIYHYKDFIHGKLYYAGLFVTVLSGIFLIVGVVTDYIGLFFLLIIILNLSLRLYIFVRYPKKHKITYPSTGLIKTHAILVKIRNISLIIVFSLIVVAFIIKHM